MSQSEPSVPDDPAVQLSLVAWVPPTRERHLVEAVSRVHAERDETGVLLAAVQSVERAVAGAASAVFRVDPDVQVVSLRAAGPRWRTAEREAPAWLTRETGGIAGFARGRAACAGRWWRRPGAPGDAEGSDIARVRILVADETWGMLVVVRPAGDEDRGEDTWFIEALAAQLGLALRNVIERTGLQRSLTAIRESRNQATRDERLQVLGQLASGLAHDFNNALTSILGVTEWLLLSRTEDDDLGRDLEAIRLAATDAAALVRRLHYFGTRKTAVPREATSLADIAEACLDVVRTRIDTMPARDGQCLHLAIERGTDAVVEVDPTALREVFVNLLMNAAEASPHGGDIVIRIGREGTEAFAAVVDHGDGMDEHTRGRVFEPFFTTKRPHGAGLGLSLCWSVIESHGGRIGVASTRGVGSTFTVWLPTGEVGMSARGRPEPAPTARRSVVPFPLAAPTAPTLAPVRARGARILLIDDQADVRGSVADMLSVLGHQTRAVGSGDEALGLADEEDFDLVITDLGMPGLSGLDVARSIHRDQPGLPILLLTGWGTHYDGRPPADITRVVAKPVTLDALDRVVREVLGRTPGGAA